MSRTPTPAVALTDRLCRPHRIGIFGHRGVGKTTLLTMLYREAVGGRLPGLRLAAADARTAEYLSAKILPLEAGQPLPATLAETELRFQLYQGNTRIELLVKDYQGEHIELNREEPIREFLRDCDAVWLCLDAASIGIPDARLRRQQEVERLLEDFLAVEPERTMDRPIGLVLTKADLLGPAEADLQAWAERFDMVRHALRTHCPHSGLFPVSSLGRSARALQPEGLAAPLAWLVEVLQGQDEARLEQLWSSAARDLTLLNRGVAAFAHRYPDAPATPVYQQRLREALRQRRRRRSLLGAAAAACWLVGLTAYDAVGYQQASRFEAEHRENPVATLGQWQRYQSWHPTRNWLRPQAARAEETHLGTLEHNARQQVQGERLAELVRQAADPEVDPEPLWQQLRQFQHDYPEIESAEVEGPRATLKERRDRQHAARAQQAFDELESAEKRSTDLPAAIARADQFLRDHPASAQVAEVRRRRAAYLVRLDERDIEPARIYTAGHPLEFQTRRVHYQNYLTKRPGGGFAAEAEAALTAIAADWDKHDFRAVRDQFEANPGDVVPLVGRCRTYLAAHPSGRFKTAAEDLLRWTERITTPQEYRVVVVNGQFDKSVARFLSRGPKLSVELEVNGIRYGPSTIVRNNYEPEWNYEFPRKIRWKLGEAVRIRVKEHSWTDRVVLELGSAEGEPLAMQLLAGELASGPHRLKFETDFALPTLPGIE